MLRLSVVKRSRPARHCASAALALSLLASCADSPEGSAASSDDSGASLEARSAALASASTGSISRGDWGPIDQEWSYHRKNHSSYGKVSPLFKCIDKNSDGSFTAHFGYKTANKDVTVPVGRFNGFLPTPTDRGQPRTFRKNTNSSDLFTVKSTSKLLAWFLNDDLVVVTAASKQCKAPKVCPASCDDGNPCTVDSCSKSTSYQCTHVNAGNGASCGDGNVCNGAETCQAPASGSASICTPGTTLSCDDGETCTTDSCDPTRGCQHGSAPSGLVCTPEAACTTAGTCDGAGTCAPGNGKSCDDNNPCTADSCDPVNGCMHEATAGVSCSDGKVCNGEETCDASGACQPGPALRCDDGNECTADSCNDTTGCVFDLNANQGKACTASGCGGSACNGGVCTPTSGVVCNDNNPCTVDSCSGNTCRNTLAAAGTSCGDADFCNGSEVCDAAGSCVSGSAPCGSATTACQTERCDSAAAACVITAQPDGTACEDNNVCTLTSSCHAGACAKFTAKTCTTGWGPGDASSCDPARGCIEQPACEPYLNGNKCQPLDPSSPAGTCKYTQTFCRATGCFWNECNPQTGLCERSTSTGDDLIPGFTYSGGERNILCGIAGVACSVVPQGCGEYSCADVTCTLGTSNPNCATATQFNCLTTGIPSTCQTPRVISGVTNILACQEGVGCVSDVTNCAVTQPLGPPGACEEYFENPNTPGCCALRPKVCRATDFGMPADTSGYAFSCEPTTGACVATPAP